MLTVYMVLFMSTWKVLEEVNIKIKVKDNTNMAGIR